MQSTFGCLHLSNNFIDCEEKMFYSEDLNVTIELKKRSGGPRSAVK